MMGNMMKKEGERNPEGKKRRGEIVEDWLREGACIFVGDLGFGKARLRFGWEAKWAGKKSSAFGKLL
jgi:hypothetical protein